MATDPTRRAALLSAKLAALVKARWGEGERTPVSFGKGAALLEEDRLWILAEDDPARSLAPAMALGARVKAATVDLLASAQAGVIARRATAFTDPPTVWAIDNTDLARAEPAEVVGEPSLPEAAAGFREVFLAAGAEAVAEAGILRAEVLGLEVARVTVDHEGAFLEVGVGEHDREAHRLVHGDRPPIEALARAVSAVKARRRSDALPHQANTLAEPRWLRSLVIARPHIAGARRLWPVAPPMARSDLRSPSAAPAAGDSVDGDAVVVVCSTGIDVDLIPSGADVRMADPRRPRLRFVLPQRDDHHLTRLAVGRLAEPADVVLVPDTWKAGLG